VSDSKDGFFDDKQKKAETKNDGNDERPPRRRAAGDAGAPVPGLEGTRWKLGFSLGREPGTRMPQGWGASGSRLCYEAVLHR
jgi:hypothetical protein